MTLENISAPILMVEDNEEDVEVLLWTMQRLNLNVPLVHCMDGSEALDYLYRRGSYSDPTTSPRPSFILLDLHLVEVDGLEVLEQVKQDQQLKHIPIIIWTSSTDEQDLNESFQHGANSYIVKPGSAEQARATVETLHKYWFETSHLPNPTTLDKEKK